MSLWFGLLFGLVGGIHCLGMCGPIMLALPFKNNLTPQIAYHTSRALVYACLGALTGFFGVGLKATGVHEAISLFAGGFLIFSVLAFHIIGKNIEYPFAKSVKKRSSLVWKSIFEKNKLKTWIAAGALNGLLPCGFVYLALASSVVFADVYQSVFYMFGFGLGTVPYLLIPILFKSKIPNGLRLKLSWLTIAFPLLLGALLILRGLSLNIPYISPVLDVLGCPSCH